MSKRGSYSPKIEGSNTQSNQKNEEITITITGHDDTKPVASIVDGDEGTPGKMELPPHRRSAPASSGASSSENTSTTKSPPALIPFKTIYRNEPVAPIPRFTYVLTHAKRYVQSRGPYEIGKSGNIISTGRYSNLPFTSKSFARDLCRFQWVLLEARGTGQVPEDYILQHLLNTTADAIEIIVKSNQLSHDVFGWGIFGLAAGIFKPDSRELKYKAKLHEALEALPEMDVEVKDINIYSLAALARMRMLTRARRTTHVCSTLLYQSMKEDWRRLRWGYTVSVCERWIAHLGWEGNGGVDRTSDKDREGGKERGEPAGAGEDPKLGIEGSDNTRVG